MKVRFTLGIISLWLLLVLSASAVEADKATEADKLAGSVRWDLTIYPDEGMRASNQNDFKELLATQWKESIGAVLKRSPTGAEEHVQIRTCRELFEIEQALYGTEDPTDWPVLNNTLLRCKAMVVMTKMRPASRSYLGADTLPPIADLAEISLPTRREELKSFFAGLRQKALERKCYRRALCRITTADEIYMISSVGSGDYNDDGVEDQVLIVSKSLRSGTAGSSFSLGVVISRASASGPIKALTTFQRSQ